MVQIFQKTCYSHYSWSYDLDESDNVFIQLDWEEYFGSNFRVYEKKHPFPGLVVNYDDGIDEEDRDLIGYPRCLNMALSGLSN